MTKISLLPNDSAPVAGDILAGVQTSSDTTENFKLSDLLTYIKNNIAAVSYNPYKASAYNTTGPTLALGTATKVPVDTKSYDTSSNLDNTTNYRFTAPIAGFYQVSMKVVVGGAGISNSAYAIGYVFKNGSEIKRGQQMQGSGNANLIPASQVVELVQLNAGDYLEMWALCSESSRSIGTGANQTYLTVKLDSAT